MTPSGRFRDAHGFFPRTLRALLGLLAASATLVSLAPDAQASGPPRVRFDVTLLIACRDVTPPEFAATRPGEKLLEAAFNISSLIECGKESDLDQFFYRIESPEHSLHIVDHLPRTEVASNVVGHIAVERHDESSAQLGGALGAAYPPFSKAEVSGQLGSKSGLQVRYEMLPPKELLAASGTLDRERGVFFKLRPSGQTSLEGAKQFVCVFRVPCGWRGDYIRITCQATGYRRGLVSSLDAKCPSGEASFLVGLYAEGDELARRVLAQSAPSEERAKLALRRHVDEVTAALHDSPIPGLARVRSMISAGTPGDLLQELTRRSLDRESPALELPSDVRHALGEFSAAKQAVHALNEPGRVRLRLQTPN